MTESSDAPFAKRLRLPCRRTVQLTRRRESKHPSPHQASYETRSRRSRPTIWLLCGALIGGGNYRFYFLWMFCSELPKSVFDDPGSVRIPSQSPFLANLQHKFVVI